MRLREDWKDQLWVSLTILAGFGGLGFIIGLCIQYA